MTESELIPCLVRVGENVKKYRLLKLLSDQVTIGRSCEVTYAILSDMISRNHAVLKRQSDNRWTIMDNKSLNGIFINGNPLSPSIPYTLQDGDIVQFGVSAKPNTAAEFVYKFYSKMKICANNKKQKLDKAVCQNTESTDESIETEEEHLRRRKIPCKKPDQDTHLKDDLDKIALDYQVKIQEMEKRLKEKEEQEKKVQEELERERKEKESQVNAVKEMKLKEQAILQELEDKQKQLDIEKENLKRKMQEELEANLKEREATLLAQLTAEKEALWNEKKQIEESLSKENAKVLEEKNKVLEEQLLNQKEKLQKIIDKKELEQKVLESQLDSTKKESEIAKLQVLQAREEILSNFVNLMEVELQCSICSELFIKATSLNCAHVFCKLCISQWMKVRKECPVCRTSITSQVQALALDSYIEKMVEQLSDEHKNKRKELILQRKADQDKFDNVKAGPSTSTDNGRTRGRIRGTGRTRGSRRANRARGRSRAQTSETASTTSVNEPIVLSDSEHFSDDTERALRFFEAADDVMSGSSDETDMDDIDSRSGSSSSESVEGESDAYYGGYGRCYNCGSRGHWSNGCPY
ncbi:galectin-6 [Biomphalaria glabrata]|nr:galectin-6 [Biomphalaria glabrata]